MNAVELLLIPVGAVLLVLGCRVWSQPRVRERIGYWHQTIPGLDEKPDRFYAQVYQALKTGLHHRDITLTGFGFGPQHLFEGSTIFSERPLYLTVRYKHLTYYLYVSQTPAGFFLSSWLYSKYQVGEPGRLSLHKHAWRYFERQTLFQYDAVLMFTESVHAIVLAVLERYLEEQGLQPLEEYERRPLLHGFYSGYGGTRSWPEAPPVPWALGATPGSGASPGDASPLTGRPAPFMRPHAAPAAPISPDAMGTAGMGTAAEFIGSAPHASGTREADVTQRPEALRWRLPH